MRKRKGNTQAHPHPQDNLILLSIKLQNCLLQKAIANTSPQSTHKIQCSVYASSIVRIELKSNTTIESVSLSCAWLNDNMLHSKKLSYCWLQSFLRMLVEHKRTPQHEEFLVTQSLSSFDELRRKKQSLPRKRLEQSDTVQLYREAYARELNALVSDEVACLHF